MCLQVLGRLNIYGGDIKGISKISNNFTNKMSFYDKRNRTTIIASLIIGILILYLILPSRFAKHYNYINKNEIYDKLVTGITRNISLQRLDECEYMDVIDENQYFYIDQYKKQIFNNEEIRFGGEYYPDECRPKFSSAIIIPYRHREEQLNQFLIYMHNFLRKQHIHYRIFIIEQYDNKPFNRAKLFNIGSIIATEYEFPCLILHDVDLMPLNLGNLYACTDLPRHMCSSLDEFRFNLPYLGLFGGAVAIQTKQYHFINGMSNMFHGWGGEDDDFYGRLQSKNINICRFEPNYSQYTMLRHHKEKPSEDRMVFLRNGPLRYHSDGLNSLIYVQKGLKLHSLFTHVLVVT